MPKRKRAVDTSQTTLNFSKRRRTTESTMPVLSRAYNTKYGRTRRVISKRRLQRRGGKARRTSRKTRVRARSSRTRRTRRGGSLASKILKATTVLDKYVDNSALFVNGSAGSARVNVASAPFTQAQMGVIQAKLAPNTDPTAGVTVTSSSRSFYLQNWTRTTVYSNASPVPVDVTIYRFTVRKDYPAESSVVYGNGFTQDGSIGSEHISATPFMSSDFCTLNRITGSFKRRLEQGQSVTVVDRVGPQRIVSDKFNSSINTRGMRSHIAKFVGSLGRDLVSNTPTTAPVSVMASVSNAASWRQLTDNTIHQHLGATLALPTSTNFRYANADTGTGVTNPTTAAI